MSLQEWFNDFAIETNNSPVRRLRSEGVQLPIQRDGELDLITKEVTLLKEKLKSTLRVALVGEVKAGKSTLINALVGSQVSPTNILEATSVIWEIGYSENSSTSIFYNNSDIKVVNKKDIDILFASSSASQDIAKTISKIVVRTDTHIFKQLYLIDTPGLATITSQNATTTLNFMQEADVILWVFNATHLGQVDVSDEISKVAKIGKPIVGILNRIDEVDDNPERLLKYLNRNSGEYLTAAFALSAYQAFNGIISNNQEKIDASGIGALNTYLMDSLNKKSEVVKLESIESSCRALARKEVALHESINRSLQFLMDQYKEYMSDLNFDKSRLSDDMLSAIDGVCGKLESSTDVEKKIGNIIRNTNQDGLALEANHLANSLREEVLNNTSIMYKTKFSAVVSKSSSKVLKRFQDFQNAEGQKLWVDFNMEQSEYLSFNDTLADSATKSAAIAGTFGLGIAAYGAWLGPFASSLTLVGGIGAVVLPFAFVGLIGGAAIGYFKHRENKNKEERLAIDAIKEQIFRAINADTKRVLSERIDEDFEMLELQYISSLCMGMSTKEIYILHNKISSYISTASYYGESR